MANTPFSIGAFARNPQAFRPTGAGVMGGIMGMGGMSGMHAPRSGTFPVDQEPAPAVAAPVGPTPQAAATGRQDAMRARFGQNMPSYEQIMAAIKGQMPGPQMSMPGMPPAPPQQPPMMSTMLSQFPQLDGALARRDMMQG